MAEINVLQFICPTGFYGAERWVLALANNLDSSQVRCDLVVTEEAEDQDLEIHNQFQKLDFAEGQAFKIPMSGRFDVRAITQLCRIIRQRDIHIIHTHGYKSDMLGLVAATLCKIPKISTPHGFGEPASLKHKLFVWLGALSLRHFDRVAPLSEQLHQQCCDYGISKSKLTYIKNGVDLREVERERSLKDSDNNSSIMTIGFIGQMVPRKKIHHILDVFESLCAKHKNVRLELLGDGSSRKSLEQHANKLACRDKIEFLGFRTDRLKRLKSFDLFVMTSSSEGIPRCLMEAMAMAIPVSAYNIPGIDQLLEHEQTALLSDFGDHQDLLACWEKLLFDRRYSETLAQNARNFVQKHFSANRMAQEYQLTFMSLLGRSSEH